MSDAIITGPCPFCGKPVPRTAERCRHCGEALEEDKSETLPKVEEGVEDPVLAWLIPIGRSGWAIASGYLGLLSCVPFIGVLIGVVAVGTGLLALRSIRKRPGLGGKGRAIFGIVAGALAGSFNAFLLVVLVMDWARS